MSPRRHDPLPCSKACDLAGDAGPLAPYTAVVDGLPEALAGQHPIRRWEYAMALRTIAEWQLEQERLTRLTEAPLQICDVGGAGSNFWQVLKTLTSALVDVVDPSLPESGSDAQTLRWKGDVEMLTTTGWLIPGCFDIITCVSVIEHVKQVRPFFRALHTLLKPGGLLFLTTDYWDANGPDTAHFHWMRERIYNVDQIRRLLEDVRPIGFRMLGQGNWAYPGPQLYDYSVCSLALYKRPDGPTPA